MKEQRSYAVRMKFVNFIELRVVSQQCDLSSIYFGTQFNETNEKEKKNI